MSTGSWVLLIAVVLAVSVGVYRAATEGRFRGTHRVRDVPEAAVPPIAAPVLEGTPWADDVGERGTLLQFSTAFCAPCRATRHLLGDVAAQTPGIEHVEIDAEHHLDLVRRLGIMRTPTTLVLDASGREVGRATGAPRRDQVLAALAEL